MVPGPPCPNIANRYIWKPDNNRDFGGEKIPAKTFYTSFI